MPRRKKAYAPIVAESQDGVRVVNTGLIVTTTKITPRDEKIANIAKLMEAAKEPRQPGKRIAIDPESLALVEPPTAEKTLDEMDEAARQLIAEHIFQTPMTRDEKRRLIESADPQQSPAWITDDRGEGPENYRVREASRELPVIRAANALLHATRRLRKRASPTFLEGIKLGQLYIEMHVRAAEPHFVGYAAIYCNQNAARSPEEVQAIVDAVDANIRDRQLGRTAAYRAVARDLRVDERTVANVYRAAEKAKAEKKNRQS